MGFFPKSWGEYPAEYNRAVHGVYYPFRYYGKPDTPFTQVKLGELRAWLGRRNKSPSGMMKAISRGLWRYTYYWVTPKKPGIAFFIHGGLAFSLIFFLIDYPKFRREIKYRYH